MHFAESDRAGMQPTVHGTSFVKPTEGEMRSVWFWARATLAGIIAGGALVATGTSLLPASADLPSSPTERTAVEALDALRQRAVSGDEHAAELLADLDTYLAARGLSVAELRSRNVSSRLDLAGAKLTVEGVEPLYVTVHNDPNLKTKGALAEYMAARRVAAGKLVTRGGEMAAVVWGNTDTPLATILDAFSARRISAQQVVVDVYHEGVWLTRAGLGTDVYPMEVEGTEAVLAEIQALVRSGADALPVPEGAELELRLHMARVSGTAGAIGKISDMPDVLFVDPISDLLDTATGRASRVEMGRVPNILMAWVGEEVAAGRRADPFQPQAGGGR